MRAVGSVAALGALGLGLLAASAPPAASSTEVSTLAGSGLPGVADGAASAASFLMPVALAYDGAGNLIVADAAAQRIRRVRKDGRVETVAGSGAPEAGGTSVRGGFADGDARSARFNWPRGVAVGKNGTIYVADTGNHCVRAIAPSGRVSVFAGSPSRDGSALGTRAAATFGMPTGIAVDSKDNVYVADPAAGVRKIDASGNVTALGSGHAPVGVTAVESHDGLTLYVTDADGILIAYPDKRVWRIRSANRAGAPFASPADPPGTVERAVSMQGQLGYPQSLSANAAGDVFFGDPRTNGVRYVFPTYVYARTIAGAVTEDAAGDGAGFRDGAAADARFNAPYGTAVAPDGSVAVADAGNRRIRSLRVGPRDVAQHDSLLPTDLPADAYPILYVGPSWVWYDSVGRDSITTGLEDQLKADRALAQAGLTPAVRFISTAGGGLTALESIAHTVADVGVDKIVVVDMTTATADENLDEMITKPAKWQAQTVAALRRARDVLAAGHVRLVVAVHPFPVEFSANEFPASRMGLPGIGTGMIPELRGGDLLRQAVAASGADMIDTYPDFRADALQPSEPVSGMTDSHYGPHGRALLGRAVARGIEKLAPWASR